jgi:hypothetical protein
MELEEPRGQGRPISGPLEPAPFSDLLLELLVDFPRGLNGPVRPMCSGIYMLSDMGCKNGGYRCLPNL